jgi:hypothetical protein
MQIPGHERELPRVIIPLLLCLPFLQLVTGHFFHLPRVPVFLFHITGVTP